MTLETQSVGTLKPSPYPSHGLTRFYPDAGGFGSTFTILQIDQLLLLHLLDALKLALFI